VRSGIKTMKGLRQKREPKKEQQSRGDQSRECLEKLHQIGERQIETAPEKTDQGRFTMFNAFMLVDKKLGLFQVESVVVCSLC